MTVKHTPGPWKVDEFTRKTNEINIWADGTPLIAKVHLRDVSINEQFANADLIAAAPDLLEVLDEAYAELLADSHRDGPRSLLLTRIEVAIAKATGEQQ